MTTTRLTMGQAIDTAIQQHERTYPTSEVYWAGVASDDEPEVWLVEVEAAHFSVPLRYRVAKVVRS